MIVKNSRAETTDLGQGVSRNILASGGGMMTVQFDFEDGAVGYLHTHPHEQVGYVAKGRFEATLAGETNVIEAGDTYYVPSGVEHGVVLIRESHLNDAYGTNSEFQRHVRAKIFSNEARDLANVEIVEFEGLTVDFARHVGATVLVRGLRAVTDFEYELMMALMNRKLNPNFETVFLMPSEQYIYLHSTLVREAHALGGDVTALVPAPVLDAFREHGG